MYFKLSVVKTLTSSFHIKLSQF